MVPNNFKKISSFFFNFFSIFSRFHFFCFFFACMIFFCMFKKKVKTHIFSIFSDEHRKNVFFFAYFFEVFLQSDWCPHFERRYGGVASKRLAPKHLKMLKKHEKHSEKRTKKTTQKVHKNHKKK